MSRIGKQPVTIPAGVEVSVADGEIAVKGPLGTLKQSVPREVRVKRDGNTVSFETVEESIRAGAMSGTVRALLANMVLGVSKGFERKLTLVGVGYRAQAQGD